MDQFGEEVADAIIASVGAMSEERRRNLISYLFGLGSGLVPVQDSSLRRIAYAIGTSGDVSIRADYIEMLMAVGGDTPIVRNALERELENPSYTSQQMIRILEACMATGVRSLRIERALVRLGQQDKSLIRWILGSFHALGARSRRRLNSSFLR